MKWFKFYGQEYLADPKMLALTAEERSCWLTLLCYSSVTDDNGNDNGRVKHLSEYQLMIQAGVMHEPGFDTESWERTVGVLKKFEELGMIHIDNGVITIQNWEKRQDTNLTGYERVKKHREKKRIDNEKITSDKSRVDKNRIDKSIERGDESPTPAQEAREFFTKTEKQESLIAGLVEKGIEEKAARQEVAKFISYWTERNKSGTKQRWEQEKTFELKRRLTTWFSNVGKFQGDKKSYNQGIQSL